MQNREKLRTGGFVHVNHAKKGFNSSPAPECMSTVLHVKVILCVMYSAAFINSVLHGILIRMDNNVS